MADTTYLDDVTDAGFQLTTGTYVSGAAHVGLLVWLFVGWGLNSEPLDLEAVSVSVVSEADFAALNNQGQPEVVPTDPVVLTPPEVETPPVVTQEDPVVIAEAETLPEIPEEEVPPQALEEIVPPQVVADDVPVLEGPDISDTPLAADLPVVSDTPQVEEAPRVGAEVVLAPPPNTDVAPDIQQEATPEAESPEVVEVEAEAAAPEEQTTEIVTEADTPSGAVEQALRPPSRPERLVAAAEVTQDAEPVEEPVETPVEPVADPDDTTLDDLLADVVADETPDEAPAIDPVGDPGPPMTGGERDAFRLAVESCWIRDTGSVADTLEIVVGFSLDRDGKVVGNIVELISSSGGEPGQVNAAFGAAQRAVVRCGINGYDLPPEKYEQWRNVELVFNPDGVN